MNTEEEPPRFVRAWIQVENGVENSTVTYPITSVTLVAEGGKIRRFAATYHHVKIGNTDFVARSLTELAAILREDFSDSPLHWEMRIEHDRKAEAARQAKLDQLARAVVSAGARSFLSRRR